ncbi:hypothetical protein B808_1157 [Fructilactobacillus florum 8D]|uniref:Uncharacterized protein n=1 Tax=Fructilactobacillus florum 8D TaxID=1221538 RepID=W9ED09_9LACO|nr:hypothetical protein B808_1157 [Fructilactobacillus florum 8D]
MLKPINDKKTVAAISHDLPALYILKRVFFSLLPKLIIFLPLIKS